MISDFKKKQNRPFKRFLLILGGILTLMVVILLVVANIKIYYKKKNLFSQIESLKGRVESIKNENENLRQGISDTNKEEYIEKVAREQLDLQKPGEKVVSFIKEDNQQQQNEEGEKNIFQVWFDWIGNAWQWIKNRF